MAKLRIMQPLWLLSIFPLTFLAAGIALLPYPGLQNDEVLFTNPYYGAPGSSIFAAGRIPLMLLSYLGAAKSWLLWPVLRLSTASYSSIRIPVLLIGALTVALFILLVEKAHGRRAAVIGGALLATDTSFLLTTCFDWGPVALQHLFLVAGMLLIVRSRYFWGSLAFGLGMWDKALFSWMLLALALATVCVFGREVWQRFTLRNILLAAAGFVLGASPLIAYNVVSGGATFRANAAFDLSQFRIKARALETTWSGSALFGYIADNPAAGQPRPAETRLERASFAIHDSLGDQRDNWMRGAFLAGLLLIIPAIWWKQARPLLFCLIVMAAAWLQMALTKGAGLAVHHAVLLWPIPHLFLAIVLAEASIRLHRLGTWLLVAVALFLAGTNLLVTNQYLYQLVRYGPAGSWTDAIYPLSQVAAHLPAEHVVIDDWGILGPLQLLHGGKLPMVLAGDDFLAAGANDTKKNWDRGLLEHGLWLGHTPPNEQFPGSTQKIVDRAAAVGYRKELLQIVANRNGRAVFEVFRFVRTPAGR